LGGIVNQRGSAADLVRELGVSKQAASQLIDALVLRGYLERQTNPEDRRRVTIDATDRGRAAAAAVRAGVEAIDEELAALVSPAELAGLRAGLIALCDIRERLEDEAGAGPPPSPDNDVAAYAARPPSCKVERTILRLALTTGAGDERRLSGATLDRLSRPQSEPAHLGAADLHRDPDCHRGREHQRL
jgi:DNA-binding MarR family transcriptional regulator